LQILLVGQPELDDKLDSPSLRQLKQRIAHRAHLAPLSLEETAGYIERRLEIAGAPLNGQPLFSSQTIASVHRHSKGIPRLINTICENALITAYARKMNSVTPEIIEDVATDLRLNVLYTPPLEIPAEFDESFAIKASRTLVELLAHLKKAPSSDGEQERP
jgi:general secretion pathway protein A